MTSRRTSLPERRRRPRHDELKVYRAAVVRTQQLTAHMNRVTLGGGDLAEFEQHAPDQFVYVFFPRLGHAGPPVERDFTWEAWRDTPETERPIGRYYTVRRHNEGAHELDLDVVLHGDGPGATWGATTRPGDKVALWGPRLAYDPPEDTGCLLLAADQTGLPAIGAILESLSPGMLARVVVEVPGESEELQLESPGDVEVMWLHRGNIEAGKSGMLVDAVRSIEIPAELRIYAWGAGEHRAMSELRKHLQHERGLPLSQISVLAYWRHQDHDDDEDVA